MFWVKCALFGYVWYYYMHGIQIKVLNSTMFVLKRSIMFKNKSLTKNYLDVYFNFLIFSTSGGPGIWTTNFEVIGAHIYQLSYAHSGFIVIFIFTFWI